MANIGNKKRHTRVDFCGVRDAYLAITLVRIVKVLLEAYQV